MKVEYIGSNNNFGWSPALHAKITKAALVHVPTLREYNDIIINAAAIGSKHRNFAFFFSPKHCYYGDKLASYKQGPSHALDMYSEKMQDSVVDWAFDAESTSMQKLGEALHFLQDMSEPLHTQKGRKNIFNISAYKRYGKLAEELDIEDIISGASNNARTNNFYDLFGDTYIKSSKSPHPLDKKNLFRLPSLTKNCIENACSSTVAFLKRLGNFYIMTDEHKIKAIETEALHSKFLEGLRKGNNITS